MCLKLDMENAQSSIYRATIIDVLEQEPDLQHMALSCVTSLAAPTALEVGGKAWVKAGDRVCPGNPSSGCGRLWKVEQQDFSVMMNMSLDRLLHSSGLI